jgi:inner membrane protein involved in colicin E2 resistance
MRLQSFTTVAIRLMGVMSIFYGLLMVFFMLVTFFMFSEGRMGGVYMMQFLLPGLMIAFGVILIAVSRSLAASISGGLDE